MDSSFMLMVPAQLYLAPGQRSFVRGDDFMDLELQAPCLRLDPPGASFVLNEAVKSFSDNMQGSVGLMRLHSAPSSMLTDPVLDTAGDEFLSARSSPLAQAAIDAEFARFFPNKFACNVAQFESNGFLPPIAKSRGALRNGGAAESAVEGEQRIGDRSRLISQSSLFNQAAANGIVEDANRGPLSAIPEYGAEGNSENFYGNSQIPLSLCRQQGGARAVVGLVSESGIPCFTSLPQSETNLVRHRSSPAGLVSRLATEAQSENSEVPNTPYSGSMMRSSSDCRPERGTMTKPTALVSPSQMKNSFESGRVAGMNSDDLGASSSTKIKLLRQSSSPAGLLSQLNLDGLGDTEKLVLPSSSGNSSEEGTFDKRGGLPFLAKFAWDDSVAAPGRLTVESLNGVSPAARKRIRELKYFAGSTSTDPQQGDALEHAASANQFSLPTATNPEAPFCPDKLPSDSVLCRARAKRGCATHPRSIAERVRRTKISERMRKLQELVPNMDKQTNYADMLDEAVEYVKLLQRQVKELTEKNSKCDGSCKQKTTSSK